MSRHDDEIRDAERRVRAAYLALARRIDDEFANREDDYGRAMHDAANRIYNAERQNPDEDPIAALTLGDRHWLADMGWSSSSG